MILHLLLPLHRHHHRRCHVIPGASLSITPQTPHPSHSRSSRSQHQPSANHDRRPRERKLYWKLASCDYPLYSSSRTSIRQRRLRDTENNPSSAVRIGDSGPQTSKYQSLTRKHCPSSSCTACFASSVTAVPAPSWRTARLTGGQTALDRKRTLTPWTARRPRHYVQDETG